MTRPLQPADAAFLENAPTRYVGTFDIPRPSAEVWVELTRDGSLDFCRLLGGARWTSPRPFGVGATRTMKVTPPLLVVDETCFRCTVLYTPDPGYVGPDSFTFLAADVTGGSAPATADLTVAAAVAPGGPAPAPTPTPVATPTSTPRPATKLVLADVVRLPSTRRCVRRRRFRIRLVEARGDRIVRALVRVNGRRVKVVKGTRMRAPVDLRGLPKCRFNVEIEIKTASGRTVRGTRRDRTCAPKRKTSRRRPTL